MLMRLSRHARNTICGRYGMHALAYLSDVTPLQAYPVCKAKYKTRSSLRIFSCMIGNITVVSRSIHPI